MEFGKLQSLVELHLSNCSQLGCLPDSIVNLSQLKTFHLQECDKLENLPMELVVATLALARDQGKGVARVRAKRKPESHIKTPGSARKCEGVDPHTPKATPMLGVGES